MNTSAKTCNRTVFDQVPASTEAGRVVFMKHSARRVLFSSSGRRPNWPGLRRQPSPTTVIPRQIELSDTDPAGARYWSSDTSGPCDGVSARRVVSLQRRHEDAKASMRSISPRTTRTHTSIQLSTFFFVIPSTPDSHFVCPAAGLCGS